MSIFDYFVKLRKLYALKSNPKTVAAFYEKFITEFDSLNDDERCIFEGLKNHGPQYNRRFLQTSLKDFCKLVSPGALDEKNLNGEHLVNVFNLVPSGAEFSGMKVYNIYEYLNMMSRYLFIWEEYHVAPDSVPPVPETMKIKKSKGASHPKLEKQIIEAQKKLHRPVLKVGTPAYQRLFDLLRLKARAGYQSYFTREKEAARNRIPVPPSLKLSVFPHVNTSDFRVQIEVKSIERLRSRILSVIKNGCEDDFHEDLFWDMMVYYFRALNQSWGVPDHRQYNGETLREFILENIDKFWVWYADKPPLNYECSH